MENNWLALSYKLPAKPTKNRQYIRRKFKNLGAVYLRQGVSMLPSTSAFLMELRILRKKIFEMGGEASIVYVSFVDKEDENRIIHRC